MKFYKVHAAKFKNDKVIFMGEQFNEIGPDAFAQTEFEFIMLSDKVTIIRDHAFSNVRNCSVFIPASVEEIEPFSFEGMDSFNITYCVKDSYAYNRCNELGVTVDTDVAACISNAKKTKETDEQNKRIAANREAEQREAERIIKEAQKEAERIKKAAQEEAERIRKDAEEEAKRKEEQKAAEAAKVQHQSNNNVVKQSVSATKPVYTGPIFVDEEHRNRPASTGTSKDVSIFRKVNEDIDTFIEHAEALKLEEEKQLKAIAEQEKNIQTKVEQKEIEKKSEKTEIQEFKEPKKNNVQIIENNTEIIPELAEEPKVSDDTDKTLVKDVDEDLFVKKFGLPPVVDFYSDMGKVWKKQISQMSTEDIIIKCESRFDFKHRTNTDSCIILPVVFEIMI